MSNLTKVYQLPDLPPAPTSDLQLLVRRLIEYADWQCLVGIVDELRAYDRNRDLRQLQYIIAGIVTNTSGKKPYSVVVHQIIGVFWFDLYDVAGTAEALAKVEFAPSTQRRSVYPVTGSILPTSFVSGTGLILSAESPEDY